MIIQQNKLNKHMQVGESIYISLEDCKNPHVALKGSTKTCVNSQAESHIRLVVNNMAEFCQHNTLCMCIEEQN